MKDRPATIGALRAAGYPDRTVKQEIARNAAARLRAGQPVVPGLVGFDDTVLPALETALLAGHDLILLGERGQAKSRILRALPGLLDEEIPVIAGSEVHDHPYRPFSPAARALVREHGEDTPVVWIGREERFAEKLATPDIAVADLIGDVDPIKVAEGRYLGDELTIHFGLVPRHNRGIVAINELPDLAERIQVALLNVMEERDVQVRGYRLRLPLDLLVVATANPEDYTNRGRIITPLKDRFGAEVRTHYPRRLADEMAVIEQEARVLGGEVVVPAFLTEVLAAFTRALRAAPEVNQRSGVSVRFSTANYETLAASAVRRAARTGEDHAVARPVDLGQVLAAGIGKIEFETFEEGREPEVLERLMRRCMLEVFRRRVGGLDLSALVAKFDEGLAVETGDLVSAEELLGQLDEIPGLGRLLAALEGGEGSITESPALAAAALEFALEGLHLTRKLDRTDVGPGAFRYGAT
ncbi:MAG TPA: AAA family ATPase [Egibacteraceae bacterium]|nr:AAA family ATPase [Egibacteraceae bacterium]